jgi:glycosyltransferase involved in cell wall biosynthesis
MKMAKGPSGKHVLFFYPVFPPAAGAGVQRGLKFAKYLPEQSWQVSVVCRYRRPFYPCDEGLLEELPAGVWVKRVASWDFWLPAVWLERLPGLRPLGEWLRSWLGMPDTENGWIVPALMAAQRRFRMKQVDIIFSSSPPASAHLAAWLFRQRYGIPWVADFRDEWVTGARAEEEKRCRWKIHSLLERLVIEGASRICVASPKLGELLESRYGRRDKIRVITNGYDEEDFRVLKHSLPCYSGRMRLCFTGSMYGESHPGMILSALESILHKGLISPRQLELVFVGSSWLRLEFSPLLRRCVRMIGYRTHGEALRFLMESDLLLLFLRRRKVCVVGKTFEYLRSGRPILAVLPEGNSTLEILRGYDGVYTCSDEDISGIEKVLSSLFVRWQKGRWKWQFPRPGLERFERRNLTGELSLLLEKALAERD